MAELSLQVCDDHERWQAFLERSPQASRYCSPEILTALDCDADLWFIERSGYPVAAVPVITTNRAGAGLPIHSYYVGLMFHEETWRGKQNRRTENVIAISGFCMQALSEHYDSIELSLHPDLTDIRGFDWFNYHEPGAGRAQIFPRYTAQVRLDDEHIRLSARSARRREEKYAVDREGLTVSFDGSIDELIHLWQLSLGRQDSTIPEAELSATRQFATTLLERDIGSIAVTRDAEGTAQAAGLMMFDLNGLVHLPVVGTSETRYGGTQLYFAMMDHAAERGYEYIDFNGANSPARGYFKHSIGGEATLYFHIRWNRPR